MNRIFTFSNKLIRLLPAICFLLVTSTTIAQTTATEEFENETNTGTFSESGINFSHTFTFANFANSGYNSSAKFLDLPMPNGAATTTSQTISINSSLNPGVSFKINSFAGYTSYAQGGLPPYNGDVTVSGIPVGSSTPVSATISIASASGSLPGGQTREANGFVNGLNFTGTALANLYFYSLTFTITDNNAAGDVGTRDFSIDHINFTSAAAVTNQFSITDASVLEGSTGTKFMTFTINRSINTTASSVQVSSSNGTATAGSDYVAFPLTTVNFTAGGSTSQTVNVTINGDLSIEPDETFNMILSNPTGGTIFDGTGVGTVLDDDNIAETFEDEPTPGTNTTSFSERGFNFTSNGSLLISRGAYIGAGNCGGCSTTALDTRVGNGGSTGNVGSFFINSPGTSFNLNSIDVFTSNNDGTSGTTGNVSVTFTGAKADGTGSVSYTITITPISGYNFQTVSFTGTPFANVQLLSVSVTLGSGINYIALDNIKYGTVTFSGVQLSINDVSVLEGTGGGATTATFTVTRSSNSSAFSVNVASSDLSATAGLDYTAFNTTLNFTNGGALSQTVTVTILHDALIEGTETFNMTLSGATNGVLYQKPVGLGTILDDDKVIETFEDETDNATTFSESTITFSASGRLKVRISQNSGSGPSAGYLTSGDNASGGSVGKITITSANSGFKLIQLDMLTYKGVSTAQTIASGPVTFIGTLVDGTTVSTIKTITPTSLTGTGFQQNITFTGTPLDNVILTSLEFSAGGTITSIDIDNINYVGVTTLPYIDITDASDNAIKNGGAASASNNTDFGTACTGSSVSKTFTIKNTGAVNLTLSGSPLAVIGGTNANQFSLTTQPAATVAANSSTTFTVSYAPTVAGTHNATITLTNNDGTNSPYVINIKGTANASPAVTTQPISITSGACTGNPVSFTGAGSGGGTLGYQWYKGATALSDGASGSGSVYAGTATTTLTLNNPSTADNASNYNLRVSSSNGCPAAISTNATLTITIPDEASATTSGSKSINTTNTIISDASCNLIATVAPSGAGPVSGNVTATVTITASVQTSPNGSPYVQRHYDIVPASNASTATATITLYFTQAELTAYNSAPNHSSNLPVDAADAANNKANIRIFQYHGTGTLLGNYSGTKEEINPADNNIVWNNTYGRWEITFNVTGFSGFYLASAGNAILPLQLISFTGITDGYSAQLQWKTADEKNVDHFEVERSTDGFSFIKIGQRPAGTSDYNFTDVPGAKTLYYYRLKIVDNDGQYTYSAVVAINLKQTRVTVQVMPNPFTDKLLLNINAAQGSQAEFQLTDMNGRLIAKRNVALHTGINTVSLTGLASIAKGTYLLKVETETVNETIKVVKAN